MKDRTKKGYATKIDIERVEKRIHKLYGVNMTINSFKSDLSKLKIQQRVIINEIKAVNKRIDKLNKDRGLSGMRLKVENE